MNRDDVQRTLTTSWADEVLRTFATSGVTDVIVSPGSRSTPLALAAARCAIARLHSVIDERAAAFLALGVARAGGLPLLICTSGSAPGHYFPALMEASEACLPILALSADRPLELQGCGAAQTTDQVRLFGIHARAYFELPPPEENDRVRRALRNVIEEAVAQARGPMPGPVHLNARLRKPLEPCADRAREASRPRQIPAPAARRRLAFDIRAIDRLAHSLAHSRRPMCVAGPLPATSRETLLPIVDALSSANVPLLAEATSQLRFLGGDARRCLRGDTFDRWLMHLEPPDLIIELGGTPTSTTYARLLESRSIARYVFPGARHRDPAGNATEVVLGDPDDYAEPLARAIAVSPVDPAYGRTVASLDANTLCIIETVLGNRLLEEGSALRVIASALPPDTWLGLGNSLPIRHADRFVPGHAADVRVLSQRGLNGIDGWIAGAVGSAAATVSPAVFVIGDVTFAHDVASLALARTLSTPLAIVVIDNGGGRIFETLPIADAVADLSLFITPPAIDIDAAARAFGAGYTAVDEPSTLLTAVRASLSTAGASVIHVRVPPHGARTVEREIQRAIEGSCTP